MRNRIQSLLVFGLAVCLLSEFTFAQDKGNFFQQAKRRFSNAIKGSRAPGFHERMNAKVLEAFKESTAETQKSTVTVFGEGGQRAMGIVVDANGLILTKFSELVGELSCKLPDGESIRAEVEAVDKNNDLALMRVKRTDLTPVVWAATEEPPLPGAWVVTPGNGNLPLSVGVVSTVTRKIPAERAFLGVSLQDIEGGVRITELLEGGIAAKADILKVNDVVVVIDGAEVKTIEDMKKIIAGHRPKTSVELSIMRDGKKLVRRVLLGRRSDAKIMAQDQRMLFQQELGGKISERRDDFPLVMQHDTVLKPEQCGSPLVNLDGEVVALNIARASRISSYALPLKEVMASVKAMKEGMGKELIVQRKKLREQAKSINRSLSELNKKWEAAKELHRESVKDLATVRVAIKKNGDDGDDELQAKLKAAVERSQSLKTKAKEVEISVRAAHEELRSNKAAQFTLRY